MFYELLVNNYGVKCTRNQKYYQLEGSSNDQDLKKDFHHIGKDKVITRTLHGINIMYLLGSMLP